MTKLYNTTLSTSPSFSNTIPQWYSFPSYLWFLQDYKCLRSAHACVQSTLSLYLKHLKVTPNTFFIKLPGNQSSRKVSTHRRSITNTSALNGVALYKKPRASASLSSTSKKRYALHPSSAWNYDYLERVNVIRLQGHSPKSRLGAKFARFSQEYVTSTNLRPESLTTTPLTLSGSLKLLTTYVSTKLLRVRVSNSSLLPLVRQRKRFIRRDQSTRPVPYLFLGYRRNFKYLSRPPIIKSFKSVQRSWLRKNQPLVGTRSSYPTLKPHLFNLRTVTQRPLIPKPKYVLRHTRWFSRQLGLKPFNRALTAFAQKSRRAVNTLLVIHPTVIASKPHDLFIDTPGCGTLNLPAGLIPATQTPTKPKDTVLKYVPFPTVRPIDDVYSFLIRSNPRLKLSLYCSTASRRFRFVTSQNRSFKQGTVTSFTVRRRRRPITRKSVRALGKLYSSNWWSIIREPTALYEPYVPVIQRSNYFKRNLSKKLRRLVSAQSRRARFSNMTTSTQHPYLPNRFQSVIRKTGLVRSILNRRLLARQPATPTTMRPRTVVSSPQNLIFSTPQVLNSPLTGFITPPTGFRLKHAPKVRMTPTHSQSFRRSPFFFTIPLLTRISDSFPTPRRRLRSSIRYLVFPDANSFKTAVFRRLNKQKLLAHSRTRVLNSLTTLKHFGKVNFNRRFFKPITGKDKLNWRFSTTTTELTSNLKYSNFFRQYPYWYKPRSKIRRIRFKPGYGRIWRTARESIREILNMPHRYQYRLTPKLQLRYFQFRKHVSAFSTLKLDFALMSCHLSPDIWHSKSLVDSYAVFLNGQGATNLDTRLFTGDFIQLTISLKFYIASRWLKNWSILKRQRINKLFYRKFRPSGTNRRVRFVRTLPNWFFGIKFTYCDVPKYFEVDLFTLSIFLLHGRTELESFLPKEPYKLDKTILNMYNWKYLT